jgi:hypothetical protein
MKKVYDFLKAEDGAVTVDWVVLTAAVVGIGALLVIPIAYSTDSVGDKIAGDIRTISIGYGR